MPDYAVEDAEADDDDDDDDADDDDDDDDGDDDAADDDADNDADADVDADADAAGDDDADDDDDVEHADVQDDGRLMLLRMMYTENPRANAGLTSGTLDSVIFGLLRTASAVHVRRTRLLCRQRMHSNSFCTAITVGAAKRLGPT